MCSICVLLSLSLSLLNPLSFYPAYVYFARVCVFFSPSFLTPDVWFTCSNMVTHFGVLSSPITKHEEEEEEEEVRRWYRYIVTTLVYSGDGG